MTDQPNVTRSRKTKFPGGVSSWGEGRVCAEDACETQLSRYNDSDRCSTHGDDPRRRR